MFKHITTCISLALLPLLFTACKHDDLAVPDVNQQYRNAGDFIKNNYDLSLFNAAVERAGLKEELNSKGPITLLAPGNTAFNELGITRPSDFERMDADSLRNAMLYHVLDRRLVMGDIPVNGVDVRYTTLYGGRQLYTTLASYFITGSPEFSQNNLFFNGAYTTKKNVTLANGSLYVIDKVMKYTPGTVQDWLSAHAEYSVFVAALKHFNLWEQLKAEGPFTVFAPDNAALAAAGITAESLPEMRTDEYIGARLFGVYILPKRRFFITDFVAFNTIYGNNSYSDRIPNDTCNYSLMGMKSFIGTSPAEYTFSVTTPDAMPLRAVSGNLSGRNDNLTDNGIIHHMGAALYMPDEAKIK
jgi:uncharacterized surface protein with fasciclin (FAS1) repeats